jgi:hypothetical protein
MSSDVAVPSEFLYAQMHGRQPGLGKSVQRYESEAGHEVLVRDPGRGGCFETVVIDVRACSLLPSL